MKSLASLLRLAVCVALLASVGCGGATTETTSSGADTAGDDTGGATPDEGDEASPQAGADTCMLNGEVVSRGTTRAAGDGCNDCTCAGNDQWACTEMACPELEEAVP
jgi:hypothetical protein